MRKGRNLIVFISTKLKKIFSGEYLEHNCVTFSFPFLACLLFLLPFPPPLEGVVVNSVKYECLSHN